ncbi:MAG TPA: DsbA family protein, partial [Dongiaceae bacterium]|nr:DsbA family protein [Dongiaceae bacterium]
ELGGNRSQLQAALASPAIKDRLRAVTDEALSRGIFGSPFVVVDDEPFWGADRLPMVDEWLQRGGW